MKRLNKVVHVTINPQFSWTDWLLYDMPAAPMVAAELNAKLKDAVNHIGDIDEVRDVMHAAMAGYRAFGACDSEAIRFLENVLNEIYGA